MIPERVKNKNYILIEKIGKIIRINIVLKNPS